MSKWIWDAIVALMSVAAFGLGVFNFLQLRGEPQRIEQRAHRNELLTLLVSVKLDMKEAGELFFTGSGYADFESALTAGIKWRQIVSHILARLATGTEFGDQERENLVPRVIAPDFAASLGLDAAALGHKEALRNLECIDELV